MSRIFNGRTRDRFVQRDIGCQGAVLAVDVGGRAFWSGWGIGGGTSGRGCWRIGGAGRSVHFELPQRVAVAGAAHGAVHADVAARAGDGHG